MIPEGDFNDIVDIIVDVECLRKTPDKSTDDALSKDTKWQCSKTVIPWTGNAEKSKDKRYSTEHTMRGNTNTSYLTFVTKQI